VIIVVVSIILKQTQISLDQNLVGKEDFGYDDSKSQHC
jgi:hypothetical protein